MIDINEKLKKQYVRTSTANALSIKDVDDSSRTVTGYFNSFNYFDHDMDVIRSGSFAKSINERGPESSGKSKVKHLLFHDFTRIVGKPNVLNEDEKGLYFETKLPDTTEGRDTLINYKEGVYDNHSIGFSYVPGKIKRVTEDDDEWEKSISTLRNPEDARKAGFLYEITEVKLYEGSVVGIGANEDTPFLGVKSSDSKDTIIMKAYSMIDRMNNQLKNGTSSDANMIDLEAQTLQIKEFIRNLISVKDLDDLKSHSKGAGNQDTKKNYFHLL